MFPLKLVHSLVSGNPLTNPLLRLPHVDNLPEIDDDDDEVVSRNRTPFMLFVPSQELVSDTYRLASIAREIGMDLHPNPSLSHIIFSWPLRPPSASSSSSSSTSSSASYSWSLPNDSVPIPFPSFATASLSNLRLFANISKGFFKLAFLKTNCHPVQRSECLSNNNLNCTSMCLYSTRTGERVETMDGLTRVLLGMGWALFRSGRDSLETAVYLYRKMDVSRRQVMNGNGKSGECGRVRELRLPPLDFRNPPLRILQYIVLMTDDAFYLE